MIQPNIIKCDEYLCKSVTVKPEDEFATIEYYQQMGWDYCQLSYDFDKEHGQMIVLKFTKDYN